MAHTIKRCSSCGRTYPADAVVCVGCVVVFEETPYLTWVAVTSAIALGIEWWMLRSGRVRAFSVLEAIEIGTALLLTGYPIFKVVQKVRDPRRPVLREMGSVWSGRYDRALILMLLLFVPFVFAGGMKLLAPALPTDDGVPFYVDAYVGAGGLIAALAIVIDQKLAFFDFRIRNTYVERYRPKRT
jgi:hypothetical protein